MDVKQPKITPRQLNMYTEPITHIYRELERNIFVMVAKRLKTSQDYGQDLTLQWQLEKMNDLRLINNENIKLLSEATGMAKDEISAAIKAVGYDSVASVDYEVAGTRAKLPPPTQLDLLLETYVLQTFREFDNYVNQSLITTNFGVGNVTKMYQGIIEETTAKVISGQISINQALSETMVKWSDKGLTSGFVDRGGNPWSLQRYADTVLRTTVNRTYNQTRTQRMSEYGYEFVLVNAYSNARPACAGIQGGVCSMNEVSSRPEYPSIYEFGYGEPDGIRGINCRHILYPFDPDVNINNEPVIDPDDAIERGELVQGQRRLEREIRKAKQNKDITMAIGDEKGIQKYNQKVRDYQYKLREYIKKHDLPRQRNREQIK